MRVFFADDMAKWEASEVLRKAVMEPIDRQCRGKDTTDFLMTFDPAFKAWYHGTGRAH